MRTLARRITLAVATLAALPLATFPVSATASSSAATATSAALPATTLAGRLAEVMTAKQINYYPSAAGWSRMWTDFDPAIVDADLATARALGSDSVRAIVFPSVFGYPTPKPEYTTKLAQFVSLAASHGMTVKLTLFDWWNGYTDITGSTTWATAVLAPYRYDNRIISIGLQNELDPSNSAAIAWAKRLVPVVRSAAPAIPVTISVSRTTDLAKLRSALTATPVDYYDYHFYGNSEQALADIRQAVAAVSPAPLVIGETGASTVQYTEGAQAAYLARVFEAANAAGIKAVAPWTLTDFSSGAIPASAVAQMPAQYQFGLYRADGTAKPAAKVVQAAWADTAYPPELMDLSFENAAGQSPWSGYLPELGVASKTQTAAHTGKWSVTFKNTGKSAAGSPSYRVAPIVPVQAGQKWHAEVWARGNAATGATQIALSWFDANSRWLGGASSASLALGTTGWTKLTVDQAAPAGAASLQIHLKSGANTGTVWFDDVAVTAS